jgi:hypothetical protein
VDEQVTDGDRGGCFFVSHTEPGQVALHGRVELDLVRLDELHDGKGGE